MNGGFFFMKKSLMNTHMGNIAIDKDVVAQYAGTVAMECFGIVGMASVNVKDGLVKLLKREYITRGINVSVVENKLILEKILEYMKAYRVEPYDEISGKGQLRHVLIRKGFKTGELMVCLIANDTKLPSQDKLIETLSVIEGMTCISINTNKETILSSLIIRGTISDKVITNANLVVASDTYDNNIKEL